MGFLHELNLLGLSQGLWDFYAAVTGTFSVFISVHRYWVGRVRCISRSAAPEALGCLWRHSKQFREVVW